jgi:hypothetical protein
VEESWLVSWRNLEDRQFRDFGRECWSSFIQ